MKPQISTGRPSRLQYGVAFPVRRLRTPILPFRDDTALAPDLDETCWIETAGRGAVEIRSIADHREDDR
jgi:hypothetical protein